MKKILLYLLAMLLCCFSSCNNGMQFKEKETKDSLAAANFIKCAKFLYNTFWENTDETEETFPMFQKQYPLENALIKELYSIREHYTKEDSLMRWYIFPKDSYSIAITASLQTYIETKHIHLPSNPINKYRCMDSIIWNNLIPDAGNEREGGNQMQLNATFGISAIWTEYMCYHYEMLLDSILKEKKIQLQLHVERERYDSLLKTQVSFFDSIGYSGSAAPMAYSDLEEKVHAVWLAGVLDLYFSLQTEDYRPDNIYKPIPDNIIAREYDTILYNIDNHRIYEYLSIANSRNNIKLCLLNVKAAWKNLMDIRKETSRRLRGKTKDIYNNATYRLQRFHLLQLKNSFEGYGVISNEDYSCLLSDTCSHEELLRASNISVRRYSLLQKLEDEYNNQ